MNCPACGYAMMEFEKECARCKNLGTRNPGAATPGAYPQMPQPQYRPQVTQGASSQSGTGRELPATYRPNWVNIGLMWGLSFLSLVAIANAGLVLGIVMDLVAIVLAFMLNGSDSPADRNNGRVKLVLEAIVWLFGIVRGLHPPQ